MCALNLWLLCKETPYTFKEETCVILLTRSISWAAFLRSVNSLHFFKITCPGIILSPIEKLIDNLTRKIYLIRTYFDLQSSVISIFNYASEVIVIMNKQIKKVGPTNASLGGSFVYTMRIIGNALRYQSLFPIH